MFRHSPSLQVLVVSAACLIACTSVSIPHQIASWGQGVILLLCCLHSCYQRLRQPLGVHLHRITIRRSRASRTNRDLRQRIPRLVPLPLQSRNHPRRRVILVQRGAQLLPRLRKLLLELERL